MTNWIGEFTRRHAINLISIYSRFLSSVEWELLYKNEWWFLKKKILHKEERPGENYLFFFGSRENCEQRWKVKGESFWEKGEKEPARGMAINQISIYRNRLGKVLFAISESLAPHLFHLYLKTQVFSVYSPSSFLPFLPSSTRERWKNCGKEF